VECSDGPKVRLALLFTQFLSPAAMKKLEQLFGADNTEALPANP